MNNLNTVIMEGNLTKDPVSTTTPRGAIVCKFTIATNRYFKVDDQSQKEVSFFPVETWSKVAKSCGDYLEKGRGIRVIGRLKQERWLGQDEKHHERVVIVAEHVEFKPQYNREDDKGVEQGDASDNSTRQNTTKENGRVTAVAEKDPVFKTAAGNLQTKGKQGSKQR